MRRSQKQPPPKPISFRALEPIPGARGTVIYDAAEFIVPATTQPLVSWYCFYLNFTQAQRPVYIAHHPNAGMIAYNPELREIRQAPLPQPVPNIVRTVLAEPQIAKLVVVYQSDLGPITPRPAGVPDDFWQEILAIKCRATLAKYLDRLYPKKMR